MHNWRDYISAGEALWFLVVFGVAQRYIPMSWWSGVLGRNAHIPKHWQGVEKAITMQRGSNIKERAVAIAIRRACQRLPFKPTCLAQASAGQIMLRHRGRSGVVVIGLRRNPVSTGKNWEAHAWLLGEFGAVTGGENAHEFTPTNVFEIPCGLSANEILLNNK
ncbi:MAG: lasso peptide biosynthesis B2 protein [Chlorobium sp.]|nr:MAG: lasso peptide biosynthesis B2 protein [Chlorobium sp.]